MIRLSYLLCRAFVLMLLVCLSYSTAISGEASITREKATELANAEVEKQGFLLERLSSQATFYKTADNEYLPKYKGDKAMKEKQDRLKNRKYWVVRYVPKVTKGHKGGGACVFVDSTSGEILATMKYK